jgi:iron complex outermembrane receptor protein
MNSITKIRPLAILAFLSQSVVAEVAIDEITVTADFRERTLAEVPFSVSVMGAEFIHETAVQHFEELVNIVPNMNWSGDGHRARYFQIRGVGELEQYQGAPNPSIGFLVDDIDFSGIGTIATLFDIESVEVLRGPQGSRYGANALGGLIYMRSVAASAERNGRLSLSIGDDNTSSIGVAASGSLNDAETTVFRFSAQHHESNGFRDNTFLNRKDSNGRDETTLRGRLRFASTERLEANVSVLYAKINNGYDAFSLDNTYTMLSDKPGRDAQESLGASLRLDWGMQGDLMFSSITAFADSNIDFSFDADWGNDDSWVPFTYDFVSVSDRVRKTISQEFRIGSDQWLIGFYALNLIDDVVTVSLGEYFDPINNWSDSVNDSFGSNYEASNVALFGQYDHDLTDTTKLSSGLRIEYRSTEYADTAGLLAGPAETMWGGELSLSRELRDSVDVYASVSKGYKAGGFNLGLVPPGRRDFDTENMVTIEAGIKSRLQDGRLQVNAAIFHNRRNDQQVRTSVQLVPGDPASFVFFTDNVGEGEALGFETEVRWIAADDWEFYGTVGLIDATLESGREMAHAPTFTFAAGIAYRNPNGFYARLDATAKDAFYFDVSHDTKSEPFELLNARVGYEGESWLVSLWARNLFDKNYAVRGFYFGNEPPDFPNTLYTRLGDPRQIGITIEKRF